MLLETTVVGNVGSSRFVNAGPTQVLNISVASSRKFGDREFTNWVSVKIWGERGAKLAPFIQTGAKILFRGRPQAKGFQRKDGTVSAELVLHADEVEFLSSRRSQKLPLEPEKKPKRKAR